MINKPLARPDFGGTLGVGWLTSHDTSHRNSKKKAQRKSSKWGIIHLDQLKNHHLETYTPLKFNSSPLENDGCKNDPFPFGALRPIFRGCSC